MNILDTTLFFVFWPYTLVLPYFSLLDKSRKYKCIIQLKDNVCMYIGLVPKIGNSVVPAHAFLQNAIFQRFIFWHYKTGIEEYIIISFMFVVLKLVLSKIFREDDKMSF